ncbi:GerMN domain-containing protein [Metabacillus iocasae]|uniref:Uncharacterized protein n=1 Tax=Priestia iocasae TaxID=2291674 RepID=A0ABS2QQF0_9BACI|nr:GerMN domain-containing protein [Metabacillus iocasae]MBM7701684.1 hypothetical protein [Metabacillus iocasae]
MSQEKWNEKQIEEILSQMPTIQDDRTPQQIYRLIEQQVSKPQKKPWVIPSIASVAALFIIVIFSMSFIQQQKIQHQSSESGTHDLQQKDDGTPYAKSEENTEEQAQLFESKEAEPELTVQPSLQNEQKKFVTIGVPDPEAQIVVPLTYLIDKKADVTVEDIKSVSTTIDEKKLGLSDNLVEQMELSQEGKQAKVTVPEGYTANFGSTGETIFQLSLEETFRWLSYDKVELYTEDTKGVELGNLGYYVEISPDSAKQKGYVTYQPSESHPIYLVPTPTPFETIPSAIEAMKQDDGPRSLKASIPKEVNAPKVSIEENTVVYEFDSTVNIDDVQSLRYMLYALMFTAKDFGYKMVKFKGINIPEVGELKVNEIQQAPTAPNVVDPS